VLIADDVKETRRSARLMMTLLPGIEVIGIARNGREAVALARKHNPDIVLMDINMPEMDGLSAARQMQKHLPHIACVIMSAHRDSDVMREAMASGVRGYLVKPFTTDELVKVMDRVIKVIRNSRRQSKEDSPQSHEMDGYLKDLANEYLKSRRADEKALELFELLAADPDCDERWLVALATIYLVRRQWQPLKLISDRLAKMPQ
jgi:YesN/AraC family two-component response regulator